MILFENEASQAGPAQDPWAPSQAGPAQDPWPPKPSRSSPGPLAIGNTISNRQYNTIEYAMGWIQYNRQYNEQFNRQYNRQYNRQFNTQFN